MAKIPNKERMMQMYCEKDAKGKWFVQFSYVDWTGRRVRTTKRGFKTKREAQDYYTNFIVTKQGDMSMRFRDFVDIYLQDRRVRIRKNTIRTKEYIINSKVLPYFGEKPINQISVADIRQWQSELIKKNYSPTYLATINSQLRAIFNYGCQYYDLKENPCKKAGSIGKSYAKEMQIYTKEQYAIFEDTLMSIGKDQFENYIPWMAFRTLYYTGIRIGEMLALQVQDIDFVKKILIVNKGLQRIDKEDYIDEPKTVKSNRRINLPDFLLADLKEYISKMGKDLPTDRLFPKSKGYFEKKKATVLRSCNLPHIRIHDLRHSHASLLIELGFSPIAVAERLGHQKVSTTLNIYGHLFPNKQAGMAEKLNEMYQEGL